MTREVYCRWTRRPALFPLVLVHHTVHSRPMIRPSFLSCFILCYAILCYLTELGPFSFLNLQLPPPLLLLLLPPTSLVHLHFVSSFGLNQATYLFVSQTGRNTFSSPGKAAKAATAYCSLGAIVWSSPFFPGRRKNPYNPIVEAI